ncbi:MAG TPA: hypothetical protein VGM36_07975 [Rhizomicrobium sp.]|jgi:hypothetical protein
MNRLSSSTILASVLLVALAGCAGKPQAPVALRAGDPDSTNPERIVCRKAAMPTGSHIEVDKDVCHTYAQWQEIEKQSQAAVRRAQRQPGSSGGN